MHHKHHNWHVQRKLSNVWRIIILISLQSRKTFDEVYTETAFQNRWDLRDFYCCFCKGECQSCEFGLEQNWNLKERWRFGVCSGGQMGAFHYLTCESGKVHKWISIWNLSWRAINPLPTKIYFHILRMQILQRIWSEEELKPTRKCPFWEVRSILGCMKRWNNSNFA